MLPVVCVTTIIWGYLRKAGQVGRYSGSRSAPLYRLKLVPLFGYIGDKALGFSNIL